MIAARFKLGLGALVVAVAATAFVIQHQIQSRLIAENHSLRQQLARLQSNDADLSNRLADIHEAGQLSNDQFNELLRLRGEVGVLRRQKGELGDQIGQLQDKQTNQVSAQDRFVLHQSYLSREMNQLTVAAKAYAQTNNGRYPTDVNQLNLDTNQTGGNASLNDFLFVDSTGPNGERFILEQRDPISTPEGNWIRIFGEANGDTEILNVGNPNTVDQ
jgi:hypothetical protein